MRRFRNKKSYIYTIIILTAHFILYFYFGFKFGFTRNPYSQKPLTILENIIFQVFPLILVEIIRIIVIDKNRKKKLFVILATLFLILVELNYREMLKVLPSKEKTFKYFCQEVIPLISYNILFSYLIVKKIYFVGIMYRVFGRLLILLSPVIPDVDWFAIGSFNILSSALIFLIFKFVVLKNTVSKREKKNISLEKLKYLIVLGFSVTLVCFMLGMFKYQPISIMSNSMNPLYKRGDVIVFKKLNEQELKQISTGSILVYSFGKKNVAHRVVDKIVKGDNVFYQTKGDNNDYPDMEFVRAEQILGVYSFHVKYIGFPSIWLYEFFKR